ncbi:hypothetical protein RhiirA5_419430 [Rhizophagus irregularis]|uniref:Uncharacterized protein n=1 Tax=Rhizophagus irregularis TaxID=588596 RepID=A0A2N0PIA3_9GLOM|nr:hypothetical protein RhiirA5_419430 [Rhizophagus irregularis]
MANNNESRSTLMGYSWIIEHSSIQLSPLTLPPDTAGDQNYTDILIFESNGGHLMSLKSIDAEIYH